MQMTQIFIAAAVVAAGAVATVDVDAATAAGDAGKNRLVIPILASDPDLIRHHTVVA